MIHTQGVYTARKMVIQLNILRFWEEEKPYKEFIKEQAMRSRKTRKAGECDLEIGGRKYLKNAEWPRLLNTTEKLKNVPTGKSHSDLATSRHWQAWPGWSLLESKRQKLLGGPFSRVITWQSFRMKMPLTPLCPNYTWIIIFWFILSASNSFSFLPFSWLYWISIMKHVLG